MSETIILDQNEQKIRKIWLRVTIVRMIIISVLAFLLTTFSFVVDGADAKELGLSGFMALTYLLFFFTLYHFAYKKFGNKFLMFIMVDGSVGIYRLCKRLIDEPFDIWVLGGFLINLSVFLVWMYYSEKLRAINKSHKAQLKVIQNL